MDVITIILVDSQPLFIETMTYALQSVEGFYVIGSTSSGSDAVSLVISKSPDVLITGYRVQDIDGISITKAVKDACPNTMIIMLTGYGDDRILMAAIEAGCSGFLTKEEEVDAVVAAIRLAADGDTIMPTSVLNRLLQKLRPDPMALGANLSDREREILNLFLKGGSSREIGAEIGLSSATIRNYTQTLFVKLGAHTKLQAVAIAAKAGLLEYWSADFESYKEIE